jgi:hypothetical protein
MDATAMPTCSAVRSRASVKGAQKPKKDGKKQAQKTLKERRAQKRSAAKQSRSLEI